jgi:hypothetical protein
MTMTLYATATRNRAKCKDVQAWMLRSLYDCRSLAQCYFAACDAEPAARALLLLTWRPVSTVKAKFMEGPAKRIHDEHVDKRCC